MITPEQTDALYDVLGAARAFMAMELVLERAQLPDGSFPDGVELERNGALQRLRDTLFETRGLLLGTPAATTNPSSREA